MQILKIAPEYFCSPLWIKAAGAEVFSPVLPLEIELSQSLSIRIEEWDNIFQSTFNEIYPPESGFKRSVDEAWYLQEGLAILKEITGELQDKWVIEYSLRDDRRFKV